VPAIAFAGDQRDASALAIAVKADQAADGMVNAATTIGRVDEAAVETGMRSSSCLRRPGRWWLETRSCATQSIIFCATFGRGEHNLRIV
jgi:hypothetical protein